MPTHTESFGEDVESGEDVADLVKQCLNERRVVDIEGLGTFRRGANGKFEFVAQAQPSVFIAYVKEDLRFAKRLFRAFTKRGFRPWIDRVKLLPGQNWPRSIERTIEISDFFIACFSKLSVSRRSHFNAELRFALDCASRLPLDEVFLIPVRLDDCEVPRRVSAHIQYVDLFPDWDAGIEKILSMMADQKREI